MKKNLVLLFTLFSVSVISLSACNKQEGQGGVKYQAVGETIAERAYNYLLDCGLTVSQLDAIRNTFLEE